MAKDPSISETVSPSVVHTTNVLSGGDAKNTARETDLIFDDFKGAGSPSNPTGETKPEPAAKPAKEYVHQTDDHKSQIGDVLDGNSSPEVKPTVKEPEEKPAEKVVDKPAEKTPEKVVEKPADKSADKKPGFSDLTDDGINREVESLKTGKQETKERFASVLRELKKERESGGITKKEFESAKAELAAMKQSQEEAQKKSVVPEDVVKRQQADTEELAMLRRQYELERDPQLKKNFDDQVEEVEKSIAKTLTEAGVPPKAVELVQKSGGWSKFSTSKEPISWTENDPATGENVVKRGTQADYAERVIGALNRTDTAAIQARVGQQVLIQDQKQQVISREKGVAKEYFKQRDEQFQKLTDAQKTNLAKVKTDYQAWVDKVSKESDWLKDKEVPATASKEDKEAAVAENARNEQVRSYIKSAQEATSFESFTKFVEQGAKGLKAELASGTITAKATALEAQVKSLQAELDAVRSAGRSVPGKGSVGSGAAKADVVKKKGDASVDSIMADMDSAFAENR